MEKSVVNLLNKLIAIPSEYPNESKISILLKNILQERGFAVTMQKISGTRFNLLAKKGTGKKSILFYGHMDTVSAKEKDKWKTNPYQGVLKGSKLFGLGASDMKGGISSIIDATSDTNAYVKIFLAVDEENISEGAWTAIKKNRFFFKDVELAISAEPSFGLGLNGVTVARTGRCIYEINFVGKPEHIINYKSAEDAIQKLCIFGNNLYLNRETLFKSKDTIAQVRMVHAESNGMSVCGHATAEIEVILGSEDSVKSVQKVLEKLANQKVDVKERKTPYLEGYAFNNFPYKKLISEIIKKHTRKDIVFCSRKSVGDDNVIASLKIPVITWGTEGGNEHKGNEFVSIKSLELLSKMYKDLLNNI